MDDPDKWASKTLELSCLKAKSNAILNQIHL